MAYSRWSTLLSPSPGQPVPPDCRLRLISESPRLREYADWMAWFQGYREWTKRFLEDNQLELTSWYIYHDVSSSPTPDEQVLAVWSNNVAAKPMYQASELRRISEHDTW